MRPRSGRPREAVPVPLRLRRRSRKPNSPKPRSQPCSRTSDGFEGCLRRCIEASTLGGPISYNRDSQVCGDLHVRGANAANTKNNNMHHPIDILAASPPALPFCVHLTSRLHPSLPRPPFSATSLPVDCPLTPFVMVHFCLSVFSQRTDGVRGAPCQICLRGRLVGHTTGMKKRHK